MMKTCKVVFWLVLLLMVACSKDDNSVFQSDNCLVGQGIIVSEARTFSAFDKIESSIFANIHLSQGPQEDVTIEAQQNILKEIKTRVVNGELKISHNRCLEIDDPVILYITIPEIRALSLTGVGDIESENDITSSDLRLNLTGVGTFHLQGTTSALDINLSGAGTIKAFDLHSSKCEIRISGVGDAEIYVEDELDVTISGVGTVFYRGNPSIRSSISGSGNIVNSN